MEVINAGVSATGTAEQLAWYELAGRDLGPDVVVLAFVINDWTDNTKGGLFTLDPDSALVQHPATSGAAIAGCGISAGCPATAAGTPVPTS